MAGIIEIDGKVEYPWKDKDSWSALPKQKMVTFRLHSHIPQQAQVGKKMITLVPPPHTFASEYTMVKPNGDTVHVRFYRDKRERMVKNEKVITYLPEFYTLEKGMKVVNTQTDPAEWYFLHNHPENFNSPIYNSEYTSNASQFRAQKHNSFTFMELEPQKTAKQALDAEFKIDEAKKLLNGIRPTELEPKKDKNARLVLTIHKALGLPNSEQLWENDDFDSMVLNLLNICKTHPQKFINAYKEQDTGLGLRARVMDCEKFQVIEYNNEKGWTWGNAVMQSPNAPKKNIVLLSAGNHNERYDRLVDYLRTNKKGEELAEAMKEYVTPHVLTAQHS